MAILVSVHNFLVVVVVGNDARADVLPKGLVEEYHAQTSIGPALPTAAANPKVEKSSNSSGWVQILLLSPMKMSAACIQRPATHTMAFLVSSSEGAWLWSLRHVAEWERVAESVPSCLSADAVLYFVNLAHVSVGTSTVARNNPVQGGGGKVYGANM